MRLIKASIEEFLNYVRRKNKKIILFGNGAVCKTYIPYICVKYNLLDRVISIIDNNLLKHGNIVCFEDKQVKIESINILNDIQDDYCILITNGDFYSVIKQLDELNLKDTILCFFVAMMQLDRIYDRTTNNVFYDYETPKIPKTIHYCWFSGNPIPDNLKECIETWKDKCPDYQFICWDESNYDIKKYRYTQEAYDMKKWAYIPDIVRLDILYEFGGFYFDTDVKIIKNLDDLRYQEAFCGRERQGHVNFGGGSGCIRHSNAIKEILDFRKDAPFALGNGNFNAEASGYYETFPLMKRGLKIEDVNQKLDGINIYASEFFSPYNYINGEDIRNDNTFSIHYFSGSWLEGGEELRKETRDKYNIIRDGMETL